MLELHEEINRTHARSKVSRRLPEDLLLFSAEELPLSLFYLHEFPGFFWYGTQRNNWRCCTYEYSKKYSLFNHLWGRTHGCVPRTQRASRTRFSVNISPYYTDMWGSVSLCAAEKKRELTLVTWKNKITSHGKRAGPRFRITPWLFLAFFPSPFGLLGIITPPLVILVWGIFPMPIMGLQKQKYAA